MTFNNDIFEYYDDELGENISIPDFGEVDALGLSTVYREPVYRAMHEAILVLINDLDINRYPCFCMNNIIFDIDREGMKEQVQNCINFFIEVEEYEKCKVLKDYLKD